jgi:hypothetical protein
MMAVVAGTLLALACVLGPFGAIRRRRRRDGAARPVPAE